MEKQKIIMYVALAGLVGLAFVCVNQRQQIKLMELKEVQTVKE